MIAFIKRFFVSVLKVVTQPSELFRSQAVETIEAECGELEHIFTILAMGTLLGIPSSPMPLTFALLPHMEDEIMSLLAKTDTAGNPLSHLFSVLKVN
jgi:hypothetical protein